MPAKKVTDDEILSAYRKTGSRTHGAKLVNMDRRAFSRRLNRLLDGEDAGGGLVESMQHEISVLRGQLGEAKREAMSEARVRKEIFNLSEQSPEPPDWVVKIKASQKKSPGVPSVLWSDWHIGETVKPEEIDHANEFSLEVAEQRVRLLVERTIDLLQNHMVNPDYPGIVVNLGGDMVSGNIHEELTASNEVQIMPQVMWLTSTLQWAIQELRQAFGNVLVVGVTGNHGRNTRKPWAKQRIYTSFDWLVYTMLDQHFQGDDAVRFLIPAGPDARYRVFNHRYLLTHGDQFRGGDGLIGPLGPITRGDHKKRSRNMQIGTGYDTLLMGHFHSYMSLERVIVNGSLKGYDEYAYSGNFGFEPARQALWLTHPEYGITFSMPVLLQHRNREQVGEWVSWKDVA